MTLAGENNGLGARPQGLGQMRYFVMEGALLGTFMVSACLFGILLEHPSSPVRRAMESGFLRRAIMGLAMGTIAVALIYSPIGMRSGAHMNPAMTLCFLRMRKISFRNTLGYIVGQVVGGAMGVGTVHLVWQMAVGHPRVNWVTTRPGMGGDTVAWIAEFLIALLLVAVVMGINKRPNLARYSGCFAGAMVAFYITFESPFSGMSLNPARTLASAIWSGQWTSFWIYLTAPPLGMLTGLELLRLVSRDPSRLCGKWCHWRHAPCIFKCSCLDSNN